MSPNGLRRLECLATAWGESGRHACVKIWGKIGETDSKKTEANQAI
jgi:hypothetical protein